jgi:hypothetical protein
MTRRGTVFISRPIVSILPDIGSIN